MSHGGEKSPQAKTLSAEVEPFVPSHNPPGARKDPLAAGDSVTAPSQQPSQQQASQSLPPPSELMHSVPSRKDSTASSSTLGDLPAYMTNCYPFVQEQSATDVRWQAGGPPPHGSLQHPYPSYSPHPEFYAAAPPPVYPGYYPGYPITPYPGGYQPHQLPPAYPQPYLHKQGGGRHNKQQGYRQNKNNRRKNKSQSSDSKSVGVQKTASGEKVIIPSKDIKKKTKTVIFVDVSQQTDFPEDLASQSLSERPSTFRKTKAKNRRKTQSQQTRRTNVSSTDSEADEAQVDSDSGYSSPKHCRNLSAGSTQGIVTQDAATGTAIATKSSTSSGGVNSTDKGNSQAAMASTSSTAMSSSGAAKPMSYAGIVAKPVMVAPATSEKCVSDSERTSTDATPQTNKSVQRNRSSQRANDATNRTDIVSPTDTLNSSMSSSGVSHEAQTKKKKRQRKRNKSKDSGRSAHSSSNSVVRAELPVAPATPSEPELGVLRFEDDEEYPDLPSSSVSQQSLATEGAAAHQPLKYSMVVQQAPTAQPYKPLSQEPLSLIEEKKKISPEDLMSPEAAVSGVKEGKNAKKRRKKALLATQAAAQEYSEITAEQKQLQENMKRPHKRTKMPIEYDLGDMLAALERQQKQEQRSKVHTKTVHMAAPVSTTMGVDDMSSTGAKPKRKEQFSANPLDSSAPAKRGKEKEGAAKKKPSTLKRVILREREEKKRLRILGECALSDDDSTKPALQSGNGVMEDDVGLSQLSQDGISDKGSSISLSQSQSEVSPVSQMSPMSMSPLSPGSPLSSGLPSPIVGLRTPSPNAAIPNIHSRRFREYCNQMLDKDIDSCCTTLLQSLCKFHDRQYHKDPTKAKSKRRLVMGLREVTKHLRLKKIKCVVISPNLERIQSRGGLDDALDAIISLATEHNVPFIFALGRKALGRAVNKLVPVSVVGIFNYDGAEETFRDLLELSKKAREAYTEMVQKYQQEIEAQTAARISKHHHHMGHNRNLSNCSGISFSSVISEPISENYPVPEPEVDEYGREIEVTSQPEIDSALAKTLQANSDPVALEKTVTMEVLNSFDEDELSVTRTTQPGVTKHDIESSDDEEEEEEEEDEEEEDEGICDKEQEVCESSFKSADNERIVSWVAEAQSCIKSLKITDIANEAVRGSGVANATVVVVENGCHDDTLTGEQPSPEGRSCSSQSEPLAS